MFYILNWLKRKSLTNNDEK